MARDCVRKYNNLKLLESKETNFQLSEHETHTNIAYFIKQYNDKNSNYDQQQPHSDVHDKKKGEKN